MGLAILIELCNRVLLPFWCLMLTVFRTYHSSFIFHPMSEQTDKESQVPPPLVPMGSSKPTSRSPCTGTLILTLPSGCHESRLSFFPVLSSHFWICLVALESLMWAINLFIPTCYIGSAISLNIPPLKLINVVKWEMQMMEQKTLKVCVLSSYSGDYGHYACFSPHEMGILT